MPHSLARPTLVRLALAASLAVGFGGVVPAANAASSDSARYGKVSARCSALRGHAVLRTGKMVIVERRYTASTTRNSLRSAEHPTEGESVDVYGCARPNGRVHRIGHAGSSSSGCCSGADITVKFSAPAGFFVVRRASAEGGGEGYRLDKVVTSIVDLRTGKTTSLIDSVNPNQDPFEDELLVGVRLDASGRAAALYDQPTADYGPSTVRRLFAFSPTGKRSYLDDATPTTALPLADLKIAGANVTWINAGVAKSATVPSIATPVPPNHPSPTPAPAPPPAPAPAPTPTSEGR